MTSVTVAATQMACSWDRDANIAQAEALIREAAAEGAQIVLIQELFETPYFCVDQKQELFALAKPMAEHPMLAHMSALARELEVVLPVSYFERANNAYYNALAILDADGQQVGHYRKSHIPDAPGYQEKFYFNPGDTGFQCWPTRYATIGAAVCWDQWFPEAARSMCLKGAEILFYPTAIGDEPGTPGLVSREHWQRTMQGHSAANVVPVVASNRIGREDGDSCGISFYGSSFITDHTGAKLAEADQETRTVITASFDLEEIRAYRAAWGLFRDRRPELYGTLLTSDGATPAI